MLKRILFILLISIGLIQGKKYHLFGENPPSSSSSNARCLIDIDIYNRPYVLPYFLRQLEQLTCPCQECYLDFHLYHVFNTTVEHQTSQWLNQWVSGMRKSDSMVFGSITIDEWTAQSADDHANRLFRVMTRVRDLDITYLIMFDSMIILLEPENLLSILISKDKPLMAPLLRSTKEMYTSTFYLNDQQSSGYYAYRQIYERKRLGCFVLNGGIKDFYVFNFQYPQIRQVFLDVKQNQAIDVIARDYSIPTYICNREIFGYIPAQFLEAFYDETIIRDLYFHMLTEHQLNGPSQTYLPAIPRTSHIDQPISKEKNKFGRDEIYVINLLRRPDRRERLQSTFDILNISARFFEAVDGKYTIDQAYLERLNIRLVPDYEDPYNQRPMNYGELGCFFSHYFIWEDMIKNNYQNGVIVLEDDVRFDAYFSTRLEKILTNASLDWDIIYLGRKIMRNNEEDYSNLIAEYLIEPSYSHWTVGYVMSLRGAKMLVDEKPLQKLLPVDEYLPIMYDHHPNEIWKSHFPNRKLKAYAFQPAILTPTHYFGEPNYISDTENTTILGQQTPNTGMKDSVLLSVDVINADKSIKENPSMNKDEL